MRRGFHYIYSPPNVYGFTFHIAQGEFFAALNLGKLSIQFNWIKGGK